MALSIIVVTGEIQSGRTSLVHALCSRLDTLGNQLGGVIQVAHLPHKEKISYAISDQATGNCMEFKTLKEHPDSFFVDGYYVHKEAFKWAYDVTIASLDKADYIVIDEIGPLELQQKGFHLLLEKLLSSFEKHLIVVTSNEHVGAIIKKYQLSTYNMVILKSNEEWEEQMNRVLS